MIVSALHHSKHLVNDITSSIHKSLTLEDIAYQLCNKPFNISFYCIHCQCRTGDRADTYGGSPRHRGHHLHHVAGAPGRRPGGADRQDRVRVGRKHGVGRSRSVVWPSHRGSRVTRSGRAPGIRRGATIGRGLATRIERSRDAECRRRKPPDRTASNGFGRKAGRHRHAPPGRPPPALARAGGRMTAARPASPMRRRVDAPI